MGSLTIIGCVLILTSIVSYDTLYEDMSIISEYTDHDKTRVIKENGKVKELYVTIDDEEYHFEFEEEKDNIIKETPLDEKEWKNE